LKGNFGMKQNLAVVGKWIGLHDTSNASGFIDANIDIEGNSVTISPVAARALQIEIGDKVLCRNIYSPHMGLRDV
ncbi:MAG: hypothetical protein ACK4PR_09120, partial [Gammaproteobacteria bacterium]